MQNSVDGSSRSRAELLALSLSTPEDARLYTRLLEEYDYNITLADDRIHVDTFYTSKAGVAIAATTGTISAISSFIIIYLMYKSKKGFKQSVYHRIMLGMSFSDIIVSLAIAFTTLPMPKDMIYRQFEGLLVRGNVSTCTIQGFFFILGGSCTGAYICSLLLYYLFSIRYKKTEEEIAKRIEPWLHAIPIIYGISISSSLVFFEALNPTPFESWCTAMTIPYWCPDRPDDNSCLLRSKREAYIVHHIMGFFFIIIVVVSIGSLILIIVGTYEQESLLKFYLKAVGPMSRDRDRVRLDYEYTWAISKQALTYFFVYASTNSFPVITLFFGKYNLGTGAFPVFHLILRPLQGFFNLLIFSYHKVDNIQRAVPGTGFSTALHQVYFPSSTEETPEFIISSLSIVHFDLKRKTVVPEGAADDMDIVGNADVASVVYPSSTGYDAEIRVGPQEEHPRAFYASIAEKLRMPVKKSTDPPEDSLSRSDSHDLSGFSGGGSSTKKGDQSLPRSGKISTDPAGNSLSRSDSHDLSGFSGGGSSKKKGDQSFSRSGLSTTHNVDTFEENDISYASPGVASSIAGDSIFSVITGALSFGVEKGGKKK